MTQRYLYIQLLLGIICFFCLFAAKAQSDYLPQTIIFKVKETHRDKCSKTTVDYTLFNQLLNEIGVKKVAKMFPSKQKEKKKGNTDLSLIYEFVYSNNIAVDEVVKKLKKLPIIEYAQPHYLPQLAYSPSDTNISKQYFLALIDAFNAWDINKGDTNITIGITDTGWDTAHLDLKGNVRINYADPINGVDDDLDGYIDNYIGWDFGMNDNNALFESTSHGVYVSGFAAAVTDNVVGIAGVGFNTKFLPIKISNAAGQLTRAYEGVIYAADHGCFVINCSWGGFTAGQFEKEVIDYAIKNKGCVVVGAAGNNDADILFYPAAYPGVLSVSATEESDFKKNTSNYGYYVDISAPGENMYGTAGNNSYGINGGTSMAAPLVSGAVALVKAQFPAYTNQQVAAVLKATTDDLNALNPTYADKLGSGRLNLFKALSTTTPQFVELTNDSIFDNNNNTFMGGDTLNIIGFFTNYLSPTSTLTITLSSTSPYVNIIDGVSSLPSLATLATASNNTNPFLVEILNGGGSNEEIIFKVNIADTVYSRNEYLTITINPDHINVAINKIATTITSKGKIGFNDINNNEGLGFYYKGEQLLFEAGFMVGDGTTRVADAVRGISQQDQDFESWVNVKHLSLPYKSDLDLDGLLEDFYLPSPMGLYIRHHAYAYINAPDDKYVIVTYELENISSTSLTNIYAGIFADWDIKNPYINKAGYDASRKLGYVYAMDVDSFYAGIKLLSSNAPFNYSLDNVPGGAGGIDIIDGFSTSEKYSTLSSSRNSAGGALGNDIAHVVSTGGISLAPGERETVSFALIAGDSLSDLQNSADAAQIRYNADALTVKELENKTIAHIYPNPTNGVLYIQNTSSINNQVTLKNTLGELIQTYDNINQIDISSYPNGVYFLEIRTNKTVTTHKVILAK